MIDIKPHKLLPNVFVCIDLAVSAKVSSRTSITTVRSSFIMHAPVRDQGRMVFLTSLLIYCKVEIGARRGRAFS